MRKSLCCATLALVLSAGGTAMAQRHAPAGGQHAAAVHRGAVAPRGAVIAPRGGATIHSRFGAPVIVGGVHRSAVYRSTYYGRYYRPYYGAHYGTYYSPYYGPHYGSSFSFGVGLSFGYPYGYYYPYAYSSYGYPYYYPYTYPPVSTYPYPYAYPYPYSGSVAPAPPAQSTQPDESTNERSVMPPAGGQDVRGFVAITDAPADATIYVDGNYAGHAADFTAEQPLSEPAGTHQIEIRAPGRRTVIVHVDIQPGRVLSYAYPQQE